MTEQENIRSSTVSALWNLETARSIKMGGYLETFLVSAVVAVLAIRAFLAVTGFPQIGVRGLHIAHILWGGLLMLVAIVLVLSFLGHGVKNFAAILGGLGFGTFIDELGKIITSDHDYFFRPTVALIYVTFVLLFILFRSLERRRKLGKQELLVNAADMMVNSLLAGVRHEEIARIHYLLDKCGAEGVVAEAIRNVVMAAEPLEETAPSFPVRVVSFMHRWFDHLVSWVWFQRAIVIVFLFHAAGFVTSALMADKDLRSLSLLANSDGSFAGIGNLIASIISSAMVVVGVIRLPISRRAAYRWFKRSILVSIFLVQVFAFYESQLGALLGLALDLVLLSGLNQMLHVEYARREVELTHPEWQDELPDLAGNTVYPLDYQTKVERSKAG